MTVTAELADGRTLEFPDGTDPAVVQATVKKVIGVSKQEPQKAQPEENPRSIGNLAGAAIEPNLALGSGMVATPLAGLAGIAGTLLPGKEGQGAEWARNVQQALTYEPKTTGGKNAMSVIAYPFEKLAEGADWAGGKAADITGSPAVGAAVNTAIQAAPMIAGSKYMPSLPKIGESGVVQGAQHIAGNLFGPVEGRAGRLYRSVAGPDKVDQVIAEMIANRQGNLTAGQAAAPAGSAEFSALQKIIESRDPSKYGTAGIEGAQEAARQSAIGTIAKTPSDLINAVELRKAHGKEAYGIAGKDLIKGDAEFAELLSRPSMSHVIKRASELAAEEGKPFKIGKDIPEQVISGKIVGESGQPLIQSIIPAQQAKYPVDSLHYIKMAMDDLIKNPERFGIGAAEAKAIGNTQSKFVDWIGNKSKAYDLARTGYIEDSIPVNQMKTGQSLQSSLSNSLGSGERPTVFANAVKKAGEDVSYTTGKPRMADLTPSQQKVVNSIVDELRADDKFMKMAREGHPEAMRRIGATMEKMPVGGPWSVKYTIARTILNKLEGKGTEKTLDYMSKIADDPAKVAQVMKDAAPYKRSQMTDEMLKRLYYPAAGISAAQQ